MTQNSEPSHLDRVVTEMVETERTYVCDLRMIVEDYLSHIIDQSSVSLSPDQVVRLFGNIEDIYEFNSELLQCLDLCDNDPVAVARCFVTKLSVTVTHKDETLESWRHRTRTYSTHFLQRRDFNIYTQFCNNYPNSVATLTDIMRNKTLAKFFRDRQSTLQNPLPLGSYLLKPVQRILKYHLLLQEMAKNFHQDAEDDEDDEGYHVIQEAMLTMTGVASYINDMKRKHEHAVRLQEVQSLLVNWKGPDLTTYGELVLEGTFKLHGAKNQRTLFLFQRVLLITRRRAELFFYKTHLSCSTLMLIDTKDSRSFSVTHYKRPKKPHTLQARSVEERESWAHHIKRIILENHQAVAPHKDKDVALEPVRQLSRPRFSADHRKLSPAAGSQEAVQEVKQDMPRPLPEGAEPAALQRLPVLACGRTTGTDPGRGLDSRKSSEDPEMEELALACVESSEDEESEKDQSRTLRSSAPTRSRDVGQQVSQRVQEDWKLLDRFCSPASEANKAPPALRSDPDGTTGSPESRRHSEAGGRRRRDSVLTPRDLLLIGKIKSYYESAVAQEDGLSLQRRESVTHIPTGLVRTSVSRFNNVLTCSCPALHSLDSPASDPVAEIRPASKVVQTMETGPGKLLLAGAPTEPPVTREDLVQDQGPKAEGVSETSEDQRVEPESKVLHLARCYSLRLRESKPSVSARIPEAQTCPRTGPGPPEESPAVESVQTQNTDTELPAPTAPPPNTRTPHPPGFHWPDVRVLRSKYSDPQRRPGHHSRSSGLEPESSGTIHGANISRPPLSPTPPAEPEPLSQGPGLSQVLQQEVEDSDGLKVLDSEAGSDSSGAEEQNFVQIRSPTSREKISIMAVVDRCRAYQDSEEYRHREATVAPEVQDEKKVRTKTPGEQNVVKNLREKFQKFQ